MQTGDGSETGDRDPPPQLYHTLDAVGVTRALLSRLWMGYRVIRNAAKEFILTHSQPTPSRILQRGLSRFRPSPRPRKRFGFHPL